MSDEVVITMTAQEAQAVASWQRITRAAKQHDDQLKQVAKTSKETGDKGVATFQEMAGSLVGSLSAWGAVTTAAGLFKRELDEIIARQDRAAGRQESIAPMFRRAASVARELTPDSLFQQVSRVAAGQEQASDLFATFEAATSAAGSKMSGQEILDAVLASAQQRPDLDRGARTALVSGALQLQKTFGGDIQTATAAVQQSFGTSRAENVGAFSKAVVPTVTDLAAQGGGKDSFRDLMGLVVGFGQRTNDPTGDRTRTALASLAKQARETAIMKGLVGKDASVLESIDAIRGNAKVQSELLGVFAQNTTGKSAAQLKLDMKKGTLTAEAAQFQAAVELFQGGDNATTRAVLDATAANRGMTPEAVAEVQKTQAAIRGSQAMRAANLAEEHERIMTGVDLNDSSAVRARARAIAASGMELMPKGVNTSIRKTGIWAGSYLNELASWATGETDAQYLRGKAGEISQTYRGVTGQAPTGDIARLIATLENTASQLEKQNRNPDEVSQLIKETNRLLASQIKVKVDAGPQAPRRAPVNGAGD